MMRTNIVKGNNLQQKARTIVDQLQTLCRSGSVALCGNAAVASASCLELGGDHHVRSIRR
jgi:site-specific recombinase